MNRRFFKERIRRSLAVVLAFACILINMNTIAFAAEPRGTESDRKSVTEVKAQATETETEASKATEAAAESKALAESKTSEVSEAPAEPKALAKSETPEVSEAAAEPETPEVAEASAKPETSAVTEVSTETEEQPVQSQTEQTVEKIEQPAEEQMGSETETAETEASEAVKALQERINALPMVDEFQSAEKSKQDEIYNEAQAISDEYDKLSEEEQGQVDTSKLEALFTYFNGLTEETATTTTISSAGTYNIDGSTPVHISATGNVTLNLTGNMSLGLSGGLINVSSACNVTINSNGHTVENTMNSNAIFLGSSSANVTVNGGTYKVAGTRPVISGDGKGTLQLNNCTIHGGGSGGSIYVGKLKMTNTTVENSACGITGVNMTVIGCTFKNCTKAIDIWDGDSVTLSGNTVFSGNTNDIYLQAKAVVSLADNYDGNAKVTTKDTVSANTKRQITTANTSVNMLSKISSANSNYIVKYDASGKYLYLWKHSHTWSYTASGNTVTVGCTSDKDCRYYSDEVTLTLSAPDMTYTGKAYTGASVENNITSVIGANAGSITYAGRAGTSYTSGTTAPTNAGKYTASVTINGKTASADFEITKADITPTVSLSDWVYGHTASTPKVTGNSGNGTVTYSYKKQGEADSTYTEVTDFASIPVGSYTLKASIAASINYNAKEATCNFAVTKQPITVEVSMDGWTYGDTAKTPGITAGSNPGSGDVTYTCYTDVACTNKTTSADGAATDGAVPKNAGTYYVKATVAETANYAAGSATKKFTIAKKAVTATVTAENKTYDGTADATVNAVVAGDALVSGDEITITGITGAFADKNAGTDKKVTVDSSKAVLAGTGAENYAITIGTEATASIGKRTAEFTWSHTDLTYTGKEQSVTATVSNAISGDTFTLTYDSNKQTAAGDYTAKVTALGNANYALPADNTKVQTAWKISYLAKGTAEVSGTKGDNDWYVSKVTITPETGYAISANGTDWAASLAYDAQGSQTATYYLKETATGFISDKKTATFKIDTGLPTGEIRIKDNVFTTSLPAITFGHFYKKTAEVTISGVDATSGIAKIAYQKVAKGASFEKNGTWTEGNSFSVTANDKSAIYARITDHAGNFVIINSDGIVVYTDATATAKETFTKPSAADITTGITVNGNTIASVKNGVTTVAESAYEIKEDKLVLKASYLQTLAAGRYTLTVSYNPCGEAYTKGSKGDAPDTSVITLDVIGEMTVSVDGYTGTYDGQTHGVNVSVTDPADANAYHVKVTYGVKAEDGTITYSEDPVTYKDAGEYTVYIRATADYYKDVVESTVVRIAPKEVRLVWSDTEFTYDGEAHVPAAAVNSEDIIGTDSAEVSVTGAQTDAGSAYMAEATAVSNSNYTLGTDVTTAFVIKKAAATVTVDHVTKHIGKADPEFTYEVTGLVKGEALQNITLARAEGEAAGDYDITATAKDGSNANYDVTFVDGKLTIEDHVKATAPAKENEVAATCTEAGSYDEVYYCTVDGCKAELERVHQTIPATGHTYGEPVFTWAEDYSRVTVAFTCANDVKHVETKECAVTREITKQASGTQKGEIVYTATVTIDGKTYADTKMQEISADTGTNDSDAASDNDGNCGDSDTSSKASDSQKESQSVTAPETGDDFNMALWTTLLIASAAGLIVLFGRRKKKA